MSKEWLSVSLEGLRAQAEEIGRPRVIVELVSNGFDEDGVTEVEVAWTPVKKNGDTYILMVKDNSPGGFRYLEDAYTLFAPSYKRDNPEKRGRFNLGEKWFLALCENVKIESITGSVTFSKSGRTVRRGSEDTINSIESGTAITAKITLTKEECSELTSSMQRLLVPRGITLTVQGVKVEHRDPVKTFKAYLPTLIAEKAGEPLRHTTRYVDVEVYEPPQVHVGSIVSAPGPTGKTYLSEQMVNGEAYIYEMGIPVVAWDCRWSANVMQKVPLNRDRDSVTDSYRKTLAAEVANAMVHQLQQGDAAGWAAEVMGSHDAHAETVATLFRARFGDRAVAYDPSDRESNAAAAASGYTVVHGGTLTGEQWNRIKAVGAVQPAGKIMPTPRPLSGGPESQQVEMVPVEDWSDGMRKLAQIAKRYGGYVGIPNLEIEYTRTGKGCDHCCAMYRRLTSDAGRITFVGTTRWHDVDAGALDTVIHELAHHFISSHHDRESERFFYDACTEVAGKILLKSGCDW